MYFLFNDDCFNKLNTIKDNSIDLVITDPPYDIHVGASGGSLERVKKVDQKDVKFISTGYDIKKFADIIYPKMKSPNIYFWCNKKQISEYFNIWVNKYKCSYEIICWHKTNALPTYSHKYLSDTEYCLYFHKGNCNPHNYEDAKTFYIAPINHKDNKLWQHPTIKPIDIIEKLIRNSSKEKDVVLDCFMGSGTTGVACVKTNRNFIGIELDNKYFEIAKNRIEQVQKNKESMLFPEVV